MISICTSTVPGAREETLYTGTATFRHQACETIGRIAGNSRRNNTVSLSKNGIMKLKYDRETYSIDLQSNSELEQLQNEKRKALLEHETAKLRECDEALQRELREWKGQLHPRKQVFTNFAHSLHRIEPFRCTIMITQRRYLRKFKPSFPFVSLLVFIPFEFDISLFFSKQQNSL